MKKQTLNEDISRMKDMMKKLTNEGWRDDDDDDDTKVLKRKPHVMPNIDEFLNRVDVDNTDDGYTYKGITYEKVWYTDDNGLYKWVWDYSTSEDKIKDTMKKLTNEDWRDDDYESNSDSDSDSDSRYDNYNAEFDCFIFEEYGSGYRINSDGYLISIPLDKYGDPLGDEIIVCSNSEIANDEKFLNKMKSTFGGFRLAKCL